MNAILFLALALVPGEGAPLHCPQPVADRGQVRGGPAIAHSFEFSNRGPADLEIIHVQPSCGCLAPRISATKFKPGESGKLDLTIGTISQPEGDNLWSVRLYYRVAGESKDQIAEWQAKAKLVRDVGLEPAALSMRGKPGLTAVLTLTDLREKPLQLVGAYPSSNHVVAELGEWQRAEKGWTCKISVRISDTCPAGKHDDALQIISRDADYREIRVPVTVIRK
jgi:hypothetical protein